MAEFDLIERIRARAATRDDVLLGIGDDAALLQVPVGLQLVVAMDTLNAGVHFPHGTAPADIGWKALAVNLSDLAAMGATPAWCTLSLSLPQADAAWLDAFLDGFGALAGVHRVALVGGDTTRGPLSVCVTVHGFVAPGRALRRDGACVGDDVWVSGTLGDAAGALAQWRGEANGTEARSGCAVADDSAASGAAVCGAAHEGHEAHEAHEAYEAYEVRDGHEAHEADEAREAREAHAARVPAVHARMLPRSDGAVLRMRLDRPTPRVALGAALAGLAHACIDVSDGLLADLAHVSRASGVGIELDVDALPASDALRTVFDREPRRALQAGGGDDYELAFTAAPGEAARIGQAAAACGVRITRIGRVVGGEGVHVSDADGVAWQPARAGWVHFG